MAETHQYVNRSNLATFLAKIKELIPSSLTFLTKTEAEETYQEKLKYYQERESGNRTDIRIGENGGEVNTLELYGNSLEVVAEEEAFLQAGTSVVQVDESRALMASGHDELVVEGGKAAFNGNKILDESDVVDSLESTSTTAPLSANQGKVLNEKFDDILTKSDVMTDTDVAMLSRIFSLPLTSYVGGGLYQASSDVISKYQEMFNSLADNEPVICEYEGVKGLYKYQGSTQRYCFSRVIADLNDLPTGVEDSLTSSSTTIALSANQGKVLDEGKQDKLQLYTETASGYPAAQIDCGAYTATAGTGLILHTNPTSSSENYAQIDVLSGSAGNSSLRLDKDGIYHNGQSLEAVNHIWMCAGKNDPGDRANLIPANGTPSAGDCILWMTLDGDLCASTIQPLNINSVSDDGQTIVYSPYTSWL